MNKDIKTSVIFSEATSRLSLDSGDSVPTLFGKVKKYFSDLQAVAFSGKYSDLTGAPTALKNPSALTISLNGTSQGAYDGSSTKSINVTASSVGAASASHTHAYNDITDKPPVPTLSLSTRTQIFANADLNDYVTAGSYFIGSAATAATIKNAPTTTSGGFLDVWYNSANIIRQEFKSWAGIPVYRWYSNGTWSDWTSGFLPLHGGTLTGTLNVKQTLYMTDEDGYVNGVLRAYSSGTSYGNELAISGNGNVFIGGGESPYNLREALGQSSGENTYISADGTIFIYTNCQTIANKLLAMSIVSNGTVTIPKTLNLTSTVDAIGKSYNSPALVIGESTGEHLEIDNNEIMAKANDTTVKVLTLNQDGGEVYIGAGAAAAGTTSGLRVWGNGTFTGTVTAPTFSGTATNADKLDGLHANEIASNPNLLDNPDFSINQRGASSYSGSKYTVDRWHESTYGSTTVNADSVTFSASTSTAWFEQYIENSAKFLGKTLTASAIIDGSLYSVTGTFPSIWDGTTTMLVCGNTSDLLRVYLGAAKSGIIMFQLQAFAGTSHTIKNAKLEVGSVATPYVPPNPAVELAKCQRYFQRISGSYSAIATGIVVSTSAVQTLMPLATSMRNAATPTATLNGNLYILCNGHISDGGVIATGLPSGAPQNSNAAGLALSGTFPADAVGSVCLVRFRDSDSYVDLSADL